MMLIPRRNDFDLFDDFFDDGFFKAKERNLMKTDIREKKDKYIISVDNLEPYIERFEGEVNEQTVFNALKNLDQVVFETTTSCNLRCEYCCYGEGYNTFDNRRNHIGHLTFGTAKIIIDYLHSIFSIDAISNAPKEPFAISFYGGEPLMNFNVIKQIVEYAKSLQFRNRTISFTMTTNATLPMKTTNCIK